MRNRVNFNDLIAKKMQRDKDKVKVTEIEVSTMDKVLLFNNPGDDVILDFMDDMGDGSNSRMLIDAFKKVIYKCCPVLQDVKLHEELEIVDPFDVVSALFSIAEINEIGEQLIDFINPDEVKETIKN